MVRAIVWFVAVWLATVATSMGRLQELGHTPPDQWAESRFFHTPFDASYEERIRLGRLDLGAARSLVASPNQAYWASLSPAGTCEVAAAAASCSSFSRDVKIAIFTERDYLLSVEIRDRYPNFALSVRWVSEKLLFVRVWWGRVLGTDLLVDVEQESFVYREMVNDGGIPFMQHQRPREPNS